MAFYDFPAEHSVHLRTSNVIEFTFSTIESERRILENLALVDAVQARNVRRELVTGHQGIRLARAGNVISGVQFVDGIKYDNSNQQQKAAA
jgi:hypothetical protein